MKGGLEFFLESNNGLFSSEHFETAGEPVICQYSAGKGVENAATQTVREVFPHMIFGGNLHRDDLNKVSFILPQQLSEFSRRRSSFPRPQIWDMGR